MKYYKVIILFVLLGICSEQLKSQNLDKEVKGYLLEQSQKNALSTEDIEFKIISEHISSASGVHHIYFYQSYNGIPISGTESSLHIQNKNNRRTGNNRFIKNVPSRALRISPPTFSAMEAVVLSAKELNLEILEPLRHHSVRHSDKHEFKFTNGGISEEEIPVSLKYMLDADEKLALVWDVSILELNYEHWWSVRVDAESGDILSQRDNIKRCNFDVENKKVEVPNLKKKNFNVVDNTEANERSNSCSECYEVLKMPTESPYHGERVSVINPAHPVASPYGWHDTNGEVGAENMTTYGNNVNAFSGSPGNYEYQPNGEVVLSFVDYQFSEYYSDEEPYKDASVVNVFYWANIIHDVLYQYGFDESAGNFQKNNYDRGGVEDDQLRIVGQGNSNICNAGFGTGRDGTRGFMRLNVCNDKDGDFDNTVILHEYGHGVSVRLVGGSYTETCLHNKEQMDEGWSDFYSLIFTMEESDVAQDPRGIGVYLKGQGPDGAGVRPYPYTTDFTMNPQTYDSIKTAGYPHGVGTIWATMLWEVTWGLIDQYGFDPDIYNFKGNIDEDAGNIMALAIVTEALKYTRCFPGFTTGRDAILEADLAIYGGVNHCIIWDAFSKRGLGVGASEGSPTLLDDGLESFETISLAASLTIEMNEICLNRGIVYGLTGGYPYGGVYSGTGVIDDGNGTTYTFDSETAGIGRHTIRYEVGDSNCSIPSSATYNVDVVFNDYLESIVCPEDIEVITSDQNGYSIPQFYPTNSENLNCTILAEYYQDPAPGILIGVGNTTVTLQAFTSSGEQSICTFNVKVESTDVVGQDITRIFPNPTSGEITLSSQKEVKLMDVIILDFRGRIINELRFNDFGFKKDILLHDLRSGVYFVFVRFEGQEEMLKIVKN